MTYDFRALESVMQKLPDDAAEAAAQTISRYPRIFLCGAGRSGLMMKAFAMRLAQMGKTVYVVGETVTPAIAKGDLLILASASGTTAGVLRCAHTAKEIGADLYSMTSTPTSPLAILSDSFTCLHAPTKDTANAEGIMGTVFEQAVLLLCDHIARLLCKDPAAMRARHANLE